MKELKKEVRLNKVELTEEETKDAYQTIDKTVEALKLISSSLIKEGLLADNPIEHVLVSASIMMEEFEEFDNLMNSLGLDPEKSEDVDKAFNEILSKIKDSKDNLQWIKE